MLSCRCSETFRNPVPAAEKVSASLKNASDALKATAQSANSRISRDAEQQLTDQIKAADSTLHSAAEDIASELPKNDTTLYVAGKPVQRLIPACRQHASQHALSLWHAEHAQNCETAASLCVLHGQVSSVKYELMSRMIFCHRARLTSSS